MRAQSPLAFLRKLGPGLITGASKNDPASITTYIKIGAQNGYEILWTMLFSYPLLAGIQEVSALIGRVTGRGVAANVRRYYPGWALYSIVALLAAANIFNLGADLSAMAAAMDLILPGPELLYAVVFGLVSVAVQILIPYTRYVSVLKWMTLVLFAYVATAFVVHVPWGTAIASIFTPSLKPDGALLTAIVAAMGATINPYLLFWQASQEVEEVRSTPEAEPLKKEPSQAPAHVQRIQLDTYSGMGLSNIIGYFIILTATVTLHKEGLSSIQSASQAAEALRPIAGNFAFVLFGAGIIGCGLLAIPVLAGSAAYAIGEALQLPIGLEAKPREAKGFYFVLAASVLIGLALTLARIDPIKALFGASLINGIVAVPVMAMMMQMSSNPEVMGQTSVGTRQRITGWAATLVMLLACLALVVSWIFDY
jgi:Mn2+/Fe2+ NRAMP family transporter